MPRRLVQNLSPRIGGALLIGTLLLFASQLRCADANNFIEDDDPALTGDGGVQKRRSGGRPVLYGHTADGTEPFKPLQRRRTDRTRQQNPPASLWDGQSPYPTKVATPCRPSSPAFVTDDIA